MFHLYGLFIGLAIVAGYNVAEKIDSRVNKVAPFVLTFGFVGARLWHVVDMWEYYSQNLTQIMAVWNGGLGIWGGIIGGAVGTWVGMYKCRNAEMNKWEILGAMVTGLPLAQAIGRLGNAVNGEFFDKVWILPWWGAEMILDLILFLVLVFVSSRAKSRDPSTTVGMTSVFIYLLGYFMIRLILNPLRMDLR